SGMDERSALGSAAGLANSMDEHSRHWHGDLLHAQRLRDRPQLQPLGLARSPRLQSHPALYLSVRQALSGVLRFRRGNRPALAVAARPLGPTGPTLSPRWPKGTSG